MKNLIYPLLFLLVAAVGCDDFKTEEVEGRRGGGGGPLAESMTGMGIAQDMQAGGSYESKPAPTPPADDPAEEKTETVEIERGFTGKGQYGQGGGEKATDLVTVPVGELFAVRERLFLMQLKQAEDLYKASNDNEMPKTQEEYMEKIVGANMLKLPDLPSGQEYVYDPADQTLKIKKPR